MLRSDEVIRVHERDDGGFFSYSYYCLGHDYEITADLKRYSNPLIVNNPLYKNRHIENIHLLGLGRIDEELFVVSGHGDTISVIPGIKMTYNPRLRVIMQGNLDLSAKLHDNFVRKFMDNKIEACYIENPLGLVNISFIGTQLYGTSDYGCLEYRKLNINKYKRFEIIKKNDNY